MLTQARPDPPAGPPQPWPLIVSDCGEQQQLTKHSLYRLRSEKTVAQRGLPWLATLQVARLLSTPSK